MHIYWQHYLVVESRRAKQHCSDAIRLPTKRTLLGQGVHWDKNSYSRLQGENVIQSAMIGCHSIYRLLRAEESFGACSTVVIRHYHIASGNSRQTVGKTSSNSIFGLQKDSVVVLRRYECYKVLLIYFRPKSSTLISVDGTIQCMLRCLSIIETCSSSNIAINPYLPPMRPFKVPSTDQPEYFQQWTGTPQKFDPSQCWSPSKTLDFGPGWE